MLSKYFNLDNVKIISKEDFALYPKAKDRNFWDNISPSLKNALVEEGEKYLDFKYPALLMSEYLKFSRNGERGQFDADFGQRRDALYALVLAECAEYKGRFIDGIIDAIYVICDEISWIIPPHNYIDIRYGTHDGHNTAELPRDDNKVIDLRSSETAHQLAVTYYLLKEELDSVSPMICERIEKKIEERMTSLYEKYDEYFWKSEVNNWNVHCNHYCLSAAMIMLDDDDRRKNFVRKVLESANVYLSAFNADGGCEEGPLYWNGSCGNMFKIAALIKYVTSGEIDLTKESKIINMATFPVKMYIGDFTSVDFADARPNFFPAFSLLYNFGEAVQNKSLMALAKASKEVNPICKTIEDVVAFDKTDAFDGSISYDKEYFYPDLQVLTLREDGMFFAAKGGNNNESHNHCDVGNFIIYKNNNPVVIDVGTQTYISKSFTPLRYTIWYNNSKHHNLPLIGGKMQKNGPRYEGIVMPTEELNAPAFCAENVKYENDRFSLDIAPCYGDDAVKKWQREFFFDRTGGKIEVTENYDLSKESEIELTLMLPAEPTFGEGVIYLSEGVKLYTDLTPSLTEITDHKMVWKKIFRLSLKTKGKSGEIKYSFVM